MQYVVWDIVSRESLECARCLPWEEEEEQEEGKEEEEEEEDDIIRILRTLLLVRDK